MKRISSFVFISICSLTLLNSCTNSISVSEMKPHGTSSDSENKPKSKKPILSESEDEETHEKKIKLDFKNLEYYLDKDTGLPKKLGSGGFGTVYKAKYDFKGEILKVAVKAIDLPKTKKDKNAKTKKEFDRECDNMLKASTHSHLNVLKLYGILTNPTTCMLVMEYMPKGSLSALLKSDEDMPWPLRIKIAKDITKGISFLHAIDLVHRDIKPANILLDNDYNPKIADFGLTRSHEVDKSHVSLSRNDETFGTLSYIAPELFYSGSKYSEATDIYALGVTFWEIATRKKPYSKVSQHKKEAFVKSGAREKIPDFSERYVGFNKYARIIEKCWAHDPEDRPSADEVLTRLNKIKVKSIKKKEEYKHESSDSDVAQESKIKTKTKSKSKSKKKKNDSENDSKKVILYHFKVASESSSEEKLKINSKKEKYKEEPNKKKKSYDEDEEPKVKIGKKKTKRSPSSSEDEKVKKKEKSIRQSNSSDDSDKVVPQNIKKVIYPQNSFGPNEWREYYGEVGEAPALPADIEKILDKPCPYYQAAKLMGVEEMEKQGKKGDLFHYKFWIGRVRENKPLKVRDTHLLTLIPKTVNGLPFTLTMLDKLIKKPIKGCAIVLYSV